MAKRHIAPLVNGRIRLRLLEEADLPMTLAWRNQDHIRKWFFNTAVIAFEQHRAWYAQYKDRDDDFVFVIEETESLNRPVGQAAVYHLEPPGGRAEFGRLMIGDAAAAGQGLAQLATVRLLSQCWGAWHLEEVYLDVKEANEPAQKVYLACGFTPVTRRDGSVHMHALPGPYRDARASLTTKRAHD